MKILFFGDIMPGGILPYLDHSPISKIVQGRIDSADMVVGTLECALGDGLPFDPIKMQGRGNIIYSPENSVSLLKEMKIRVVSLANNHLFDLSFEGYKTTVRCLEKNNICFTGAGENLDEALKPAIIESDGLKIAFIAGCTYDSKQVAHVPVATKDTYGIVPLEAKELLQQIARYKQICDYVIILAHWGREYTNYPLKSSIALAEDMIAAGADLIIGSHPHMVQPKVRIKNKDVYFSLGNGLFPDFFMNVPRPIWYPDSEEVDISTIPITYEYPYPVTRPLLRVWPQKSRIGMVVNTEINNGKMQSKGELIELSDKNELNISDESGLKIKLKAINLFIQSCIYDEGKMIGRCKNFLFRIGRKLNH